MNSNICAVIVSYNGMRWIERCLKSLEQSSVKINIIIIDNNSTDGTQEFIRNNYPEILLVKQRTNLGFGISNNIGIKKAMDSGADYVFILNQDVYVQPDTINHLVAHAIHNPEFGIISPIHLNGDGTNLDFNFKHYLSHGNCPELLPDLYFNRLKEYYEINFANAAAWLISKECLNKVGGFNPVFHMYGEDDNYVHRLHFHSLRIALLPQAIIFHDREFEGYRENQEFISNIIQYSNPNLTHLIEVDIEACKRQIKKNKILLRLSRIKYYEKKLKKLKTFPKELSKNRELSMKVGPTFLNI